jgi:hypothetical protein
MNIETICNELEDCETSIMGMFKLIDEEQNIASYEGESFDFDAVKEKLKETILTLECAMFTLKEEINEH